MENNNLVDGNVEKEEYIEESLKFKRKCLLLLEGRTWSRNKYNQIRIQGSGAIQTVFNDIFQSQMGALNPLEELTDREINIAIKNTIGLKPSLFVPELTFEILIKKQIKMFGDPCFICCRRVYEEIKNMINEEMDKECDMKIKAKIMKSSQKLLIDCYSKTNSVISNFIELELAYINTSHPEFARPEREENVTLSDIELIKALLVSYFTIVKKNLLDLVPKTIVCFLVNNFKNLLFEELIKSMTDEK
jgi:dynamin 1-like protein